MSRRSARLIALRRREWEWQDRRRGYTPVRTRQLHYPRSSRRQPVVEHDGEAPPRRRTQMRQPQPARVIREALGCVALVGATALLLYSICQPR